MWWQGLHNMNVFIKATKLVHKIMVKLLNFMLYTLNHNLTLLPYTPKISLFKLHLPFHCKSQKRLHILEVLISYSLASLTLKRHLELSRISDEENLLRCYKYYL